MTTGSLAGGFAKLKGVASSVEGFIGGVGCQLDAGEFEVVGQNVRSESDRTVEVGGGFVQLTESTVGEGALVEVAGGVVGFDMAGQFANVVFRTLMGIDCGEGEGTENGEFRIENGELLGLKGYWLRRMVG